MIEHGSSVRVHNVDTYNLTHASKRIRFWESLPIKPTPGSLLAAIGFGIVASVWWISDRYDEAQNQARILEWSQQMSARLADIIVTSPNAPLDISSTERFYPKVKVMASGTRTYEERLAMERSGLPVNYRNYPALDGRGVEVWGQMAQGDEIINVIVTKGWGVFYCPKKELQGRVCAMDFSYILSTQ